MKVLWLCNIVLPDFAEEYGIKRNTRGGWMTGMLHEVQKNKDIDIALTFPIIDQNRLRDGVCNGHPYFSFYAGIGYSDGTEETTERFCEIIRMYEPDIVHIWGTEYPWCLEMVTACGMTGLTDRLIINIQGLVSVYAKHFFADIPERYRDLAIEGSNTIREDKKLLEMNGMYEERALKETKHVFGRTDWDRACVFAINPQITYHHCGEILRDEFYEAQGCWNLKKCQKYRIFVSQANYPIKGLHYLLQAIPIVLRMFPDVKVMVAGGMSLGNIASPYQLYIRDLIKKLHLEHVVSFIGKLEAKEMIEQYEAANVFVSSSSIENSSNSICEAMLIGTPVVSSYVGGVSTFLVHENNGLMYPESEIYMLADLIIRLFDSDELCRKLSVNATKSMTEYVSKEKAIDTLIGTYKTIL